MIICPTPRLSGRFHGLRWLEKRFKGRRILGVGCIPREVATNHMDWRASVVEDLVWETHLLQGDNGGWNASISKREC
jgi:hypothetical protein